MNEQRPTAHDPVRARRRQVARHTKTAKRVGYTLFLLAIAIYAAGLLTTFSETVARAVVACLIAGSVVLAPAIILGYAVNAAEREDRSRGL